MLKRGSGRKKRLYGGSHLRAGPRDGMHGPSTGRRHYTFAMRIPRMRFLPGLAAGLVLWGTLPAAQAQWVWRDREGRVTASDLPPPRDVLERDILQRPDTTQRKAPAPAAAGSAAAPAAPASRAPADPQLEARRRAADQEQQAKARAEEERNSQQRAENCRRARGHLIALESGQRIARTNEKGEREILDDKGRAEEMRRAQEVIASDCR